MSTTEVSLGRDLAGPPHRGTGGTVTGSPAQRLLRAAGLHVLLVTLGVTFLLPFLWMVLTSLKPLDEVGLQNWLPEGLRFRWGNYGEVFQVIPFGRFYWNSLFVAAWVTSLQVFTSSLAAFSFARISWKGRDRVFLLYLATMMLPGLVMMIPNYQLMIRLGLVDSYLGLIVPAAFSAFGTFLLRQFMLTIPTSLDEAAEIDGASRWQVYWDVILPLCRPGLITLTIFTFIGNYHSFFWPLVMLKSVDKYTLPIGLLFFDSTRGQTTHLLMAAVTMSVVPMVVLFVVLQRYLVRGIQLGAVKG
jgi:ABC-type glycerol-3-phosphate transport system permease component